MNQASFKLLLRAFHLSSQGALVGRCAVLPPYVLEHANVEKNVRGRGNVEGERESEMALVANGDRERHRDRNLDRGQNESRS